MTPRRLKRHVLDLLAGGEIERVLEEVGRHPADKVLPGLFASLCSCEPLVKWHGVTAMGMVIADLADTDMEAARVVMRRFMWMLNDESGGIGWGVPEAMSEVCARHERLAAEYGHIVVSFMREDGFYLELEALQRGLMWGVGRLAPERAPLLRRYRAPLYLMPYLDSPDAVVRGLAARAAGLLGMREAAPRLAALTADEHEVPLYENATLAQTTVAVLARQAAARLP